MDHVDYFGILTIDGERVDWTVSSSGDVELTRSGSTMRSRIGDRVAVGWTTLLPQRDEGGRPVFFEVMG